MEKQQAIDYETCSASVFYDSIVEGGESASEALYYLIKERLALVLGHLYRLHGEGIQDEFDDTIDDFFLYLHDGAPSCVSEKPFAVLESVKEKNAFFSWVISTYRYFLMNKRRTESRAPVVKKTNKAEEIAEELPSDEFTTSVLANAIAYADQQLQSRNRFIFYRLILSLLDRSLAIPQEAMAKALDMHPVTYRVCTKRQKDRFLQYIMDQERGVSLALDAPHKQMRDNIVHCFDQLYELLLEQYDQALTELPFTNEVLSLRIQFSEGRDNMMHEPQPIYGCYDAGSILDRLKEEGMGGDRFAGGAPVPTLDDPAEVVQTHLTFAYLEQGAHDGPHHVAQEAVGLDVEHQ